MCIHAIRKVFGLQSGSSQKRELAAYEASIKAAQEAAVTPADSEAGRQASESRLRKLLSGSGVGSFLQAPQLSQAQIGVRTLLGQ